MDARVIRVLAAVSVLMVMAFGVLWNRDAFLEQDAGGSFLGPEGGVARVEAGLGVRVHVVGQTGVSGAQWQSRAWFAHADVTVDGQGHITARCQTPTPISRCAIWLSVSSATPADRIEIVLSQHAFVTGAVDAPNVAIEELP